MEHAKEVEFMDNKIIIISNTDGAMYKFRKPLVNALGKHGYETTCIVSPTSPEGSYIERLRSICLRVVPVNFFRQSKFSIFFTPFQIFWTIHKINPTLIHIYGHEALIYSILPVILKRNTKKFITITGLGKFFSTERNILQNTVKSIIILIYRTIIPFISNIIFLNKHDLDLFTDLFPNFSNKFKIINGEGSEFTPAENYTQKFDKTYRFLYASRIMAEKGIIELIDAFRLLPENYTLDILGTIDKSIEHHSSVTSAINGDFKNIHFFGFQDDIYPYIMKSDCVALPTKYPEGLPIILVEALSKGKFLLTSNAPGCADTVQDGINGLLLTNITAESIAAQIEKINKIDLHKAHNASIKLFKEKFSADIIVNKILEIYQLP